MAIMVDVTLSRDSETFGPQLATCPCMNQQCLCLYVSVRRGRLGVQLVLPPTDEAPYYLRKSAGDIVSGGKSTSADGKKKPTTKEESDEDEDSD